MEKPNSISDECPNCHCKLNCTMPMRSGGRPPKVGDFSLCVECGAINRFGDGMLIHTATIEEQEILSPAVALEIKKAQDYIKRLNTAQTN